MKNLKLPFFVIALSMMPNIHAQNMLSIGAGSNSVSSDAKNIGIGNSTNFQLGYFHSLMSNSKVSFGINATADYFTGKPQASSTVSGATAYPISGLTSSANTLSVSNPSGNNSGMRFSVGPQLNFNLGENFIISPALNVGYISQNIKGSSATQTIKWGEQTIVKELYKQEDSKISGVGFTPKIRMQYLFGKIGIWLEGNYNINPKTSTNISTFSPNGTPLKEGYYSIDQILSGKSTTSALETSNNNLGVNLGIVIPLGGKNAIKTKGTGASFNRTSANAGKGWDGTVKGSEKSIDTKGVKKTENNMPNRISMTPTTTKQTQGSTFGEKVNQEISTPETVGKSIDTKGVKRVATVTPSDKAFINSLYVQNENGKYILNPTQFSKVTKNQDLDGHRFVVKKDAEQYVYIGDESKIIAILQQYTFPINTLPENYVQECTDCTTRTCEHYDGSTTTYDCGCVNGFCYCPLCVEISRLKEPEEKIAPTINSGNSTETTNSKVVEKATSGLKDTLKTQVRTSSGNTGQTSGNENTPEPSAINDFNSSRSNRERGTLSTNPNVNTGKEEISIDKIGVNIIDKNNTQGKSISSKGVKRSEAMAKPGNPIGGIIVKGGKNPGGNAINLVTDDNGEVTFTVNETGEYKLQITNPETSNKSISEKGVRAKKTNERRRVEVLKSNATESPDTNNSISSIDNTKGQGATSASYASGIMVESNGKSISSKGVKRSEAMAKPENPLGGVIVKGGKIPSDNAIHLITNENGEVTFTVNETGEYKLQITNPDEGNAIQRESQAKPRVKVKTATGKASLSEFH